MGTICNVWAEGKRGEGEGEGWCEKMKRYERAKIIDTTKRGKTHTDQKRIDECSELLLMRRQSPILAPVTLKSILVGEL